MKNSNYYSIMWFFLLFLVYSCSPVSDEFKSFKICANPCPTTEPWKVESLDLGLPCFVNQDLCLQWAKTHGYSDKPCVQCN